MAHRTVQIDYQEFDKLQDLTAAQQHLLKEAERALDGSYAPYSNFHVGVAIALANGETVCGSNQENAAYPSGICGERAAIYYTGSHFPGVEIKSIAVVARRSGETRLTPACPCGACRQAMLEYEERQKKPIELIFKMKENGVVVISSVQDTLPFKFGVDSLG